MFYGFSIDGGRPEQAKRRKTMKRHSYGRRRALALVPIVTVIIASLIVASLLPAGSGTAVAQQAGDIYASADLRPEGSAEGPPPAGSAYGTATFERLADGKTSVKVTAAGLPPNTKHANHVHTGSCTGQIIVPLQDLSADTSGNATATTQINQQ